MIICLSLKLILFSKANIYKKLNIEQIYIFMYIISYHATLILRIFAHFCIIDRITTFYN